MYSLIIHGKKSMKLQKWRNLSVSVKLCLNVFSALSNPYSSASAVAAADVSPRDVRKGKNFTVSYLVDSLGLTPKLAQSISRKVSFEDRGNPDSVLNLFRSHGFTDSHLCDIITDYPLLLLADGEKSLAPKLKSLQSRGGATTSELTEILTKAPKMLGIKKEKTISIYYDFVKEIVEADKCLEHKKLCQSSLPQGSPQENKIRNVLVLRELGVPQRLLFSLLISDRQIVCGRERFEESLQKVVEMGFDPTSSKFVDALHAVYQLSDKAIQEKINACERLGFAVGDVWEIFKKDPTFLTLSEKKILNSMETFLGLGFSRDEFKIIVKCFPQCIGLSAETVKKKTQCVVKQMNWPLKAVTLFPPIFGYSMEKRIVPRCNVIKALMSEGLLGKGGSELPSMSRVFACTDESFLNKYVKNHNDKQLVPELMAIFTGGRVS